MKVRYSPRVFLSLSLSLFLFLAACQKKSVNGFSRSSQGTELNNPELDPDDSDGIFVGNGNQEQFDSGSLMLTSCYLEVNNVAICNFGSDFDGTFDSSLVNIIDENGVIISANDLEFELIDENTTPKLKIVAQNDVTIKGVLDTSYNGPVTLEKKKASIGMNLANVDVSSTQLPFINLAKSARMWAGQKPGQPWDDGSSLDLDENGYIKSLEPDQKAQLVFLTLYGYQLPFDKLIVSYQGKGTISYTGLIKDEEASTQGRDVLSLEDPQADKKSLILTIESTDPSDYIRDISIVPENQIALHEKGEVFNPLWVERVKTFKLFKFTAWMATDASSLASWDQRSTESQLSYAFAPPGRYKGVPIELLIKLANRTNTDPWFNIPHLANDDFTRQFANLVKSNLNTNLTAYIEHSSETWSTFNPQGKYGSDSAIARWGNIEHPESQWQGMRTVNMCNIWKQEWGTEASRVHCTLGVQRTFYAKGDRALECPSWVAEGNEACGNKIDSVGIDASFDAFLNGGWDGTYTDTIRAWFSEADGGLTKAYEQLLDGRYLNEKGSIKGLQNDYAHYKEVANRFGIDVVAFGGGSQVNNGPMADDDDFVSFHLAVNRGDGIYDIHLENLAAWKDAGGALYVHSVDFHRANNSAHAGALEHLLQESGPHWNAITEFNTSNECWWDDCK